MLLHRILHKFGARDMMRHLVVLLKYLRESNIVENGEVFQHHELLVVAHHCANMLLDLLGREWIATCGAPRIVKFWLHCVPEGVGTARELLFPFAEEAPC